MVSLKTSEHEHIRKLGTRKWNTAHTAAMRAVLKNDRMTGMDKIRMALVTKAALKGTGYDTPPFLVPTIAGRANQAVQDIASQAFEDAVDAVNASDWRNG